jgi:site-specific DNA-methyltransferase (adenine-specific)
MTIQLMQGDCLELMQDIPDGSIDCILTDLPYQVTACRWDKLIPFEPLWTQYKRVIKRNGVVALFGSQPFASALVMSNLDWFRYDWIWEKHQGVNPLNAKIQPLRKHEQILVFYKHLPTYNAQMTLGKPYRAFDTQNDASIGEVYGKQKSRHRANPDGSRYPVSIQKFRSDKKHHPTQKPVPLLEYLIRTYTNEGETVLDSCMGSGSTGVAAIQTGRHFIGIELDEHYFCLASRRIANAQALQIG